MFNILNILGTKCIYYTKLKYEEDPANSVVPGSGRFDLFVFGNEPKR